MDGFLWVLLAILLTPVAALTTFAFLTTASLRRANRLLPGRAEISAPISWLWSPSAGALLHRRLRSTCQLVGTVASGALQSRRRWPARRKAQPYDGIAELAREVLQEAVLLDRQLLAWSRFPRGAQRNEALVALEYQVRAVEDAGRRVHQLATRRAQLSRTTVPGALSLDQRIAAMEAALGELAPRPPLH